MAGFKHCLRGSRTAIHDRYCHGVIAWSASHLRTIDTDGVMPSAAARPARSGVDHRAIGMSWLAVISHAHAVTAATSAAA